jgi:hypothetical protein
MKMKSKLVLATLALCSTLAFALPTTQDVQGAVNSGDYARADQMMGEVVAAKPQSAKAHYVYAEILAHEAKFDEAARQANEAQRLDPSLGFTDPQRFRNFEQLLQREQRGNGASPRAIERTGLAPAPLPAHANGGVPGWVWVAGLALAAFLVFRMVSRRAARAMPAPAYGGGYGAGPGYGAQGPGYGYGPGPTPGGSALGTGLAVAGGVAGGMLLEKYLEGQRNDGYRDGGPGQGWVDDGSGQAAQELEQRPIDFGQGNDWGGDAGSSNDFTPSGDDNGGGW